MQTEGERLRYFIENKEVNIRQFCLENDILYTSLHPILQGSRPLGMNILKKIMEVYPNLNVNWILTGLGDVEIVTDETSLKKPISDLDPGYEAFLKYLEKDMTQEILRKFINEVTSQKTNKKE